MTAQSFFQSRADFANHISQCLLEKFNNARAESCPRVLRIFTGSQRLIEFALEIVTSLSPEPFRLRFELLQCAQTVTSQKVIRRASLHLELLCCVIEGGHPPLEIFHR